MNVTFSIGERLVVDYGMRALVFLPGEVFGVSAHEDHVHLGENLSEDNAYEPDSRYVTGRPVRRSVVLAHAGGKLRLLTDSVDNRPDWEGSGGLLVAYGELRDWAKDEKCCGGSGEDGVVELYNSDNELLGTEVVPCGDTVRVDAPDSLVTLPNGGVKALPSGQGYMVPRTDELEWLWSAGDGGSAVLTVDGRYADDYDVFTDDGGSGTVEVRINGGSWAVPSGVVTLVLGDTLEARRSVWSAQGWLRFERVLSV